jgi:hypothetical protein
MEFKIRKEEPPTVALPKRSRSAPLLQRGHGHHHSAEAQLTDEAAALLPSPVPGGTSAPQLTTEDKDETPEKEKAGEQEPTVEGSEAEAEERPKRDQSVSANFYAAGAVKLRESNRSIPKPVSAAPSESEAAAPIQPPPPAPGAEDEAMPLPKGVEEEEEDKVVKQEEEAEAEVEQEVSVKAGRKWTDPDEPPHDAKPSPPLAPEEEARVSAEKRQEAKGKEKIEHWRKKFISKVGAHHHHHQQRGPHHGIKVVLPPPDDTTTAEPNDPGGADIPRRRSFSEVATEDSNALLQKV